MSTSTEATDALLRSLDARFSTRRQGEESSAPSAWAPRQGALHAAAQSLPEPDAYLSAAAVLHVFDPAQVRGVGDGAPPTVDTVGRLVDTSAPAVGWRHAGLRTLRPIVRRTALQALGTRDALRAALAANPERSKTSVQRMFERWVAGDDVDLNRMTYLELEDFRQLYDWGLGSFPGMPSREDCERARMKRSAVAVFEHLVDQHFVGRRWELRRLHGLVDSPGYTGPLVISGVGGSGKTALIGRFLIDHVETPHAGWTPFAYLPFDSETLDVREPFTLLLAIAAQLSAQTDPSVGSSDAGRRLSAAEDEFRSTVEKYRDRRSVLQRRASTYSSRGDRIGVLADSEQVLFASFANFVHQVARHSSREQASPTPIIVVFDTFEEVVYRAAEDLLGFWELVAHLEERIPELRVVIAGRGSLSLPPFISAEQQVVLGDLDDDEAVELLVSLGIGDPLTALSVARQIGGNPLSLRLAASVARLEHSGREGLEDFDDHGLAVQRIGAELVRGQLYRRLLGHIHDPDVRALAHPGMVLRRVTTGVIEGVLAPGCDLPDVDAARSRELFAALAAEQALVSLESDGSLRYREEVRRPVLELLANDKPAQVKNIHERAVEYYQSSSGPPERAEELYHRMMLRQSPALLDDRWEPGVERFLASSVDELPPAQRRWLAGRMSIELPPHMYALAEVSEWERLIGHKAMEVLRYGGAEPALSLLSDRAGRTPESPLFAIEARALLDLHRPEPAAELLDRALAGYPLFGNPGRRAELLWLRAQAAIAAGQASESLSFLDDLVEVTSGMSSALALVQALTQTLEVYETVGGDEDPRIGPGRRALSEALLRLSEPEIAEERSLVRLALVRLGPNYPSIVARLASHVVYELSYFADRALVDLSAATGPVLASLRRADVSKLLDLAIRALTGGDPLDRFLQVLTSELSQRAGADRPSDRTVTQLLCDALLAVLRAEGASLSGASLAGIDDYREPWELQFTAEVAG